MKEKYIKKDLSLEKIIVVLILLIVLTIPIFYFPKYMSALWFIWWFGIVAFSDIRYEKQK